MLSPDIPVFKWNGRVQFRPGSCSSVVEQQVGPIEDTFGSDQKQLMMH